MWAAVICSPVHTITVPANILLRHFSFEKKIKMSVDLIWLEAPGWGENSVPGNHLFFRRNIECLPPKHFKRDVTLTIAFFVCLF